MKKPVFLFVVLFVMGACGRACAYDRFVEHNITDLDLISQISKFRSGAGHDFSYDASFADYGETDTTEPPSSMKHYFMFYEGFTRDNLSVPVYAPYDGEITRVCTETSQSGYTDKQVWLRPAGNADYDTIVFHMNLLDIFPQALNSLQPPWEPEEGDDPAFERTTFSAGEVLGYVDLRPENRVCFDVAVMNYVSEAERHYVSFFDVMNDGVFAQYQDRGVESRDELIIAKEFRIENPVQVWGQDGYNPDDWVVLNAPKVVPEPISSVLFLVGAGVFGVAAKRRRRAAA